MFWSLFVGLIICARHGNLPFMYIISNFFNLHTLGAYIHKKFIKNDRFACHGINRVALKGQAAALAGASATTNKPKRQTISISPPSTPRLLPEPEPAEKEVVKECPTFITPVDTLPEKRLIADSAELRAATALAFLSSSQNVMLY